MEENETKKKITVSISHIFSACGVWSSEIIVDGGNMANPGPGLASIDHASRSIINGLMSPLPAIESNHVGREKEAGALGRARGR